MQWKYGGGYGVGAVLNIEISSGIYRLSKILFFIYLICFMFIYKEQLK
jgi:hypothetical protein